MLGRSVDQTLYSGVALESIRASNMFCPEMPKTSLRTFPILMLTCSKSFLRDFAREWHPASVGDAGESDRATHGPL
jgi:hypothetical protein